MSDPYRDLYRDAVVHILRLQARALKRDIRLMRELRSLNQKADQLMTQHDDANAKLDKLAADLGALITAIKGASSPPTPEDWSDVLAKVDALDVSVTGATPAAPAA